MNKRFKTMIGFYIGIGAAMLVWYLPIGYTGERFSGVIANKTFLKVFNRHMSLLLVYVAVTIFWDHVYLVLAGVNAF